MGNAALLWNNLVDTQLISLSASTSGPFTPVTYLLDPHPGRRWMTASGATSASLAIQLNPSDIDTIAVIAPVGSAPTMRASIQGDTIKDTGVVGGLYDPNYLPLVMLLDEVITNVFRIDLIFTGFSGAGVLVIGKREEFATNFQPNWSRGFEDRNGYQFGDMGQLFDSRKYGNWKVEADFNFTSPEQRNGFIEMTDVRHRNGQRRDMLWIRNVDSDNLSRDCIWGRKIPADITQPYARPEVFAVPVTIEERGGVAPYGAPDWAMKGANLDLDFNGDRLWNGIVEEPISTSPLISTSRASTAYAQDVGGVWQLFSANTPRVLRGKGILIEDAQTNYIPNNSMQGAVAGTPGTMPNFWAAAITASGISRQVVGFGTLASGVEYIDIRWFGTPTGSGFIDMVFGPTAGSVVGQSWTLSVFMALIAGSYAGVASSGLFIVGEPSLTDNGFLNVVATSVLTRYSLTHTRVDPAATVVSFRVSLTGVIGQPVNITLRIGWPQAEPTRFTTSPIRTTAAQATRSADLVTVPTTPNQYISLLGETMFWDFTPLNSTQGANIFLYLGGWHSSSGSGSGMFATINQLDGFTRATVNREGVLVYEGLFATLQPALVRTKVALTAKLNDAICARNGVLGNSDNILNMPPFAATRIAIGSSNVSAGNFFNGNFYRVWFAPYRVDNATLIEETTL